MAKILTFLGTGPYQEVTYSLGEREVKTRYIQEALVDIVGLESEIIIFLTENAKKDPNWVGGEKKNFNTGEVLYNDGLKDILDKKGVNYRVVDILDGKNNDELWDNFDRIYDVTEENDEVYVDITHSFRSIPVIFMSVLNYAKFTKEIKLKGVYYGAFEAREDGVAPIFDLSLFNSINDWTVGVDKLITSGDGSVFTQLTGEVLGPILKKSKGKDKEAINIRKLNESIDNFTKSLKVSRGNISSKKGITKTIGEQGSDLKKELQKLRGVEIKELKPFNMVVDKILNKVSGYGGSFIEDIHYTVCLCRDLGLIQQAYTLLTENIINYVQEKRLDGIEDPRIRSEFINSLEKRKESIMLILSKHKHKNIVLSDSEKEEIKKVDKYLNSEIASLYDNIGDYRNDLAHAGYRQDMKTYKYFEDKVDEFIKEFERLMLGQGEL